MSWNLDEVEMPRLVCDYRDCSRPAAWEVGFGQYRPARSRGSRSLLWAAFYCPAHADWLEQHACCKRRPLAVSLAIALLRVSAALYPRLMTRDRQRVHARAGSRTVEDVRPIHCSRSRTGSSGRSAAA
jgi:hypothetical protein